MQLAGLRRRIEGLERWDSGTVKVLGLVEVLLSIMLFIVAAYALAVGDDWTVFAVPAPIVLACGLFQGLFFSNNKAMTPSLGILLISETWFLAFVILSVPFYLSGFSATDSLFEAVSGFTTTGATILSDMGSVDGSILLWRAIIQWAGGITVVIIFSVLLPMLGMGGSAFSSNEFSGSESGGYVMKVTSMSFNFMRVYFMLTFVEIVILVALGVTPFESVCISFSDIPTGGLLPRADSMVGYSFPVQFVTLVFMFLGATNYYLLFRTVVAKGHNALAKSVEFRRMIEWFVATTIVITAVIVASDETMYSLSDMGESLWHAAYCVVSAGTSAGFAITDYTVWPTAAMVILLVVEFVGGMSGSTSGGIKIYRLMALKSYIGAGMEKIMHPNMVTSVRVEKNTMSSDDISSAISTIFLFMFGAVAAIIVVLILEPGLDVQTVFGLVFAAVSNAGVGSGSIGPLDSYAALGDPTKFVMIVLMWLGRMEFVLAIIIFTRGFWGDVRLSAGFRGNKRVRYRERSWKYRRRKLSPAGEADGGKTFHCSSRHMARMRNTAGLPGSISLMAPAATLASQNLPLSAKL